MSARRELRFRLWNSQLSAERMKELLILSRELGEDEADKVAANYLLNQIRSGILTE
jgi:hypothetical protein